MGMGSPLKRSSTIFALMVESVTIVLPCRNEETRIEACLDSLLRFTGLDEVQWEIWVFDGAAKAARRMLMSKIT